MAEHTPPGFDTEALVFLLLRQQRKLLGSTR